MAWLLIISGIILIIYGLYEKYRQYQRYIQYREQDITKGVVEKQDSLNYCHIEQQQAKLEEINCNLEKIITEISHKEKEIRKTINDFNVDGMKKNCECFLESPEQDFKKLLDQIYTEPEKSILSTRYRRISTLAKQGLSIEKIAEKLDLGIRETELIMKFHRKEEDSSV